MNGTSSGNDILERAITELRQRRKKPALWTALFTALKRSIHHLFPRAIPQPGSGPRLALAAYTAGANAGEHRTRPGRIG